MAAKPSRNRNRSPRRSQAKAGSQPFRIAAQLKPATPVEAKGAEIDALNDRDRKIQDRLTKIHAESSGLYNELHGIEVKRLEKLRELDQLARGK